MAELAAGLADVQKELDELTRRASEESRKVPAPTRDQFLTGIRARREHVARVDRSVKPDIRVVRPSPMILPSSSDLRREPPRAPEDRQPDYLEKFDALTLFYDAFRTGDDIWLSGPPLRNLTDLASTADWQLDGRDVRGHLQLRDWGRTQRSSLAAPGPGSQLSFSAGDLRLTSNVGADGADLFAGRRVVVTKSKDNDLVWIQDFLRYYLIVHGVTGVVFYNNNSTRYDTDDVAAAISEVDGIEVGVVVDWPFPWGPGGGPKPKWDSDFCQFSLLEHARFRFLRDAAGVVNADIDELVLTDDGRTVFEHAEDSLPGTVLYWGVNIAKATAEPMDPDRQRRYVDYRYRLKGRATSKWTTIPRRVDPATTQWRVHHIVGTKPVETEAVRHRHYQGVNTTWKYDREETVVEPGKHVFDEQMSLVLDIVFGDPADS
jgi:hypothetical protein